MTFFKKKSIFLAFFLVSAAIFTGCAARIDGVVREGGAANLRVSTSIGPRTSALIRSFMTFMSENEQTPTLDGAAISRSMATAPGIEQVSLKNTGPASLEGSISLTRVGDFLSLSGASGGSGKRFITYTEGRAAASSSIIINLDRNSAPELISMLSPEVEENLSALMAPAVLGETSTRQEYLSLLTSFYGRPLSDEIAAARIRVLMEFPRPVAELKGGTASGKQAQFDIPLTDILVLEKPLQFEIIW